MMQNVSLHSPKHMPQLGLSAYWCLFTNESDDRTTEINQGPGDAV
jgi:hypothetical protein